MDIAKVAQAGDTTLEQNGLKFFVEKRASDMLMSTTIDFAEGQGFILTGMQQNACGTCKC